MRAPRKREDSPLLPTPWHIIRSTFGHVFTAIACLLAGFAIETRGIFPARMEWLRMAPYIFFLMPYYVNRNILDEPFYYEKLFSLSPGFHRWIKDFGIQLALVLAVCALIGAVIVNSLLVTMVHIDPFWRYVLDTGVALLPFIFFCSWTTRKWDNDICFSVRYRSFFPALATVGVSFLMGWSMKSGCDYGTPLYVLIVLLYWYISLKLRSKPSSLWIIGLSLIAVTIIASWLTFGSSLGRTLTIINIAIFLTLIMSISEAWRVTTRIRERVKDLEKRSESDPGMAGSLAKYQGRLEYYTLGTNLATSIFPPFMLLSVLHPNTNNLFVVTLIATLSVQYTIWYKYYDKWKYATWNWAGFSIGIIFPIVIWLGISLSKPVIFRTPFVDSQKVVSLVGLYACGSVAFFSGKIGKQLRACIFSRSERRANAFEFVHVRNCMALTGFITSLMLSATMIIMFFYEAPAGDTQLASRAGALMVIFSLAVAVLGAFVRWPGFLGKLGRLVGSR